MKKLLLIAFFVLLLVLGGYFSWYYLQPAPENAVTVIDAAQDDNDTLDSVTTGIINDTNDIVTEEMMSDAVRYNVAEESYFGWEGRKVGGKHRGTIDVTEGYILVLNDLLVGGDLVVNMESIVITDIQDEDFLAEIKNEFFEAAQYPVSRFNVTSFDEATQTLQGDLTIRDITKTVAFPVDTTITDDTVTVKADFSIERAQRGLNMREIAVEPYIYFTFDLTFDR